MSGLDALHVDASAGDASADASSDATDDGLADSALATDAVSDGAGIACGKIHCAPTQTCCADPANGPNEFAYTCAGSCDGGIVLHCDDKSDCTGSVSPVCCLSASVASCGLSTGSCVALCSADIQCGFATKCVPFDAGFGLSLSKCQ